MERDHHQLAKQEISSSLLSPKTNKELIDSPRNYKSNNNNNNNIATANDRLKRDEWSEGAVSSLLEAYEAKWILRNRAKLKGQDWEDVAKHVSARANNAKSAKTLTQCKNKIESMKKRYRSVSAAAEASLWPLYPRLDHLLRGNGPPAVAPPSSAAATPPPPLVQSPPLPPQPMVAPPALQRESVALNLHAPDAVDGLAKGDANHNNNNIGGRSMDRQSEKNPVDHETDRDSSTPAVYTENAGKPSNLKLNKNKGSSTMKRKREEYWDIGESFRWLAEVVVRSEQARMDTMKEIERMRAEAETKRGEMDLKRTEIIAKTQLEIAKLFAASRGPSSIDSSLRIGRS